MTRPITLFTGQWADLPFEEVCRLAAGVGLRRARDRLLGRPPRRRPRAGRGRATSRARREILERHGLEVLGDLEPPHRSGRLRRPDRRAAPGHPAGPRLGRRRPRGRAAARRRGDEATPPGRPRKLGVDTVVGFTGSAIWQYVAMFPPVPRGDDRGRATRTSPTAGTRSSTCSTRWACGSPTRCTRARSPTTTGPRVRTLEAIGHRPAFGLNWDPSATWSGRTSTRSAFIWDFQDRIYHVDCKDVRMRVGNGRNGRARLAPALGRPAPRLGLRLDRPRRRAVGGLLPHAQRDRLRRPHLGRVGGRRHGPPGRCRRGRRTSCAGSRSTAPSRLRRRLQLRRLRMTDFTPTREDHFSFGLWTVA